VVPPPLELPSPTLCLVTDTQRFPQRDLAETVSRAIEGGVNMLILREKTLPDAELLALAKPLREATAKRALLLISERPSVAAACAADGVHWGEAASATASPLLTGRSVHSRDAAKGAQAAGAHYLLVGTVFATDSKPGKKPEGLGALESIRKSVTIPCLAIGGIEERNVLRVMLTGVRGVAVVSAILGAADPRAAAANLRHALERALWEPAL